MSAEIIDLLPLVGGADRDDDASSSDGCFDARRRVLEDYGTSRIDAQISCSEEERVWEWFPPEKAGIIRGDANFGNRDAG